MKPQTCDVLTYDCPKCGVSSTTVVVNKNAPVRVWRCNRWVTYEDQKPAERGGLLTRLLG